MDRPEFDDIKDFAEFSKYYWYRDELIKICKTHGLKAPSGKIELNKVIEAYFSGEKILPDKKPAGRKQKIVVTELTLDTGLIACGFTFGNRFRDFFRKQTGEENFKFNVDMVETVKVVKSTGDEDFTLVGFQIALIVCGTLVLVVLVAKTIGCTLPLLAHRLGFDPAVMASPLITTIVDAISLTIYFMIATNVLHLAT